VDQRRRHDEALLHAVRVALGQFVAPFVEVEERQQLAGAVLHLGAFLSVESGHEAQELGAREFLVHVRAVRHEAAQRFGAQRLGVQIEAAQAHAAGARFEQAHHQADGGRLAGTVGAEKAEDAAARDLEVETVDGDGVAVAFRQLTQLDHRSLMLTCGPEVSKFDASVVPRTHRAARRERTACALSRRAIASAVGHRADRRTPRIRARPWS
jgi:hypothetical protein